MCVCRACAYGEINALDAEERGGRGFALSAYVSTYSVWRWSVYVDIFFTVWYRAVCFVCRRIKLCSKWHNVGRASK